MTDAYKRKAKKKKKKELSRNEWTVSLFNIIASLLHMKYFDRIYLCFKL